MGQRAVDMHSTGESARAEPSPAEQEVGSTEQRDEPLVGVAGRPVAQPTARQLLHLQRTAGNVGVSRLLAGPPVLQRLFESEQEKVDKAQQTLDVGDIKAISNYSLVKPEYRQKMIHALAHQGWAGPRDEWAMEALWGLYGDKLLEAANDNVGDWEMSLARGAELEKLPAIRELPGKFLGDVQGIALGYLTENEAYAKEEIAKVGGGKEKPGQPRADPNERLTELKEGARIIGDAKKAQQVFGGIDVGYRREYRYDVDGRYKSFEVPAKFVPFRPPPLEKMSGPTPPEVTMRSHAEVQAQYDLLTLIIEGIKTKYPALYAVSAHGEETDLGKVAEGSPEEARGVVVGSLNKLIENINITRGKLNGKLLYELQPIQSQLFSGAVKGGWRIDWSDPVPKAVAKELLQDHEDTEFWVTMGLSGAAAAAFVVASIATGGLAAVAFGVGLGIGAGQAAASWDKAYELSKAASTSLGKKNQLVDPSQVDTAVFAAVLDTVFAFLDLAGVGRVLKGGSAAARQALTAGAKKAALKGLELVAQKAPAEAIPLIERGVIELGVEATAAQAKLTPQQLLKILGEMSTSEAAKRLKAYVALPAEIARLTGPELEKRVLNLAAEMALNKATGEAVARVALERMGPSGLLRKAGGWQKLSLALGNESAVGNTLKSWRDGLVRETEEFAAGGAAAVGAKAEAKAGKEAARGFLAGRAGVAMDTLEALLAITVGVLGETLEENNDRVAISGHKITLDLAAPVQVQKETNSSTQRVVQRQGQGGVATPTGKALAGLTGTEFEMIAEPALRSGHFKPIPPLPYLVAGHYNASGWGIDRIGFAKQGNLLHVYHIELKYVREGSLFVPALGISSAGTQTGLSWTDNAVEQLISAKNPVAEASRENLRKALEQAFGHSDEALMRSFLRNKVKTARVAVIAPGYANLSKIFRQVGGLIRSGRSAIVIRALVR